MVGRKSAMLVALLFVSLMMVPAGSARCPDPPADCNSVVDLNKVKIGNARTSMGAYENDPEEDTSVSTMRTSEQQTADGKLSKGEFGGVLVIVDEVGDAKTLTFTFPTNPNGLEWQSGHVLTIDSPVNGSKHVLPFKVTNAVAGVEIQFTATDGEGQSTSGVLLPFGQSVEFNSEGVSEEEAPSFLGLTWLQIGLLAVATIGILVFFKSRR